jgi:class 3 adenylate cyclase
MIFSKRSAIDESYRFRLVWTILNDFIPFVSIFALITILIAEKYGDGNNALFIFLVVGALLNSIIIATGNKYVRLIGSIIVPAGFVTIWFFSDDTVRPVLGVTILISTLYALFDAIISELSDIPRPFQRAIGYLAENLNRFVWMFFGILFISNSFDNISLPTISLFNIELAQSTTDLYLIMNLTLFIFVLVASMLMLVWRNEQLRSMSQKLKVISSWNIEEETLEKDLLRNNQSELRHVERTILFGDIRGFTSFSEENSLAEVVSVLHQLYHIVEKVLVNYSNAKPEFIADEFIVFMNDPMKAVQFADEVIFSLGPVLDPYDLSVGIGVDKGDIIEGIVGSESSKKYTGFGRAVNTASRLQGIAEGGEILASKAVVKDAPKALFELKDKIKLKGIQNLFPAYRLVGFEKNANKTSSVVDNIKSKIGVN